MLHELENIHLRVPVSRDSGTYGRDFAQRLFLMMRMLKQTVVQMAARMFMIRLLKKFACSPSFQTRCIHRTKNHTIGPMQRIKSKKAERSVESLYNKNRQKVASANRIEQKTNVPFLPSIMLIVVTPSSRSSLC